MCNFSFKREKHFEKHFTSLHASDDTFSCVECPVQCSSEAIFKQHMEFHKKGFQI